MTKTKARQVEVGADHTHSFLTRVIFDSPQIVFVLSAFSILICKVGISQIPNFGVIAAIAANPFQYPTPQDPDGFYQMWNWLTPYLGWLLHLNTGNRFLALHFAFALGFLAIVTVALFRNLPDVQARIALIVFLVMPVSGSVIYWLCYDAPALFLMALAIFVFKNRYILFAIGVLLGMQDFEPTVVAFGVVLVAKFLSKKNDQAPTINWITPIAVIAGALVGRIVLTVLFSRWGLEATTGRLAWFQKHVIEMKDQVVQSPGLCVWALLGLAWVVLFLHVVLDIKLTRVIIVPLLVLSVLLLTTADKTRVMAVATFPLLSMLWLQNEDFLAKFDKRLTTLLAMTWLVAPWMFIWGTSVFTSTFFGSQQGLQSTLDTLKLIFGF
jgi:hypothetical protein